MRRMSQYPSGSPYAPYPQHPQYGQYPPPGKRSGAKWIVIGVASLVGALVLCCGGGIGLLIYLSMQTPEDITVATDVPVYVEAGEQFAFTITVQNTASEPQTLNSIDISESYLDGITIRSTSPAYSQSIPIPIADMQSYEFHRTIPAGGSLDVTFNATALQPGDYSGGVDIVINQDWSYLSRALRTVVEPADPSSSDADRLP